MTIVLFLFALFVIKHFIADFVCQCEYMLKEKGTYGAGGGVHHALFHGGLTTVIVLSVAGCVSNDSIL